MNFIWKMVSLNKTTETVMVFGEQLLPISQLFVNFLKQSLQFFVKMINCNFSFIIALDLSQLGKLKYPIPIYIVHEHVTRLPNEKTESKNIPM